MSLYCGIDIGGTKIAAGLVTDSGNVQSRLTCPTPAREGGQAVLQTAIALSQRFAAPQIVGIGVGCGGQVDAKRGVIVSATDVLPRWGGVDVKSAFEAALNKPTTVDNDVNALALGEARFGAARGKPTVVFLALGTGVGGALLIEGRLHHGAHWSGGEFGHLLLTMDPNARRDSGGHLGTLEAYCSGAGLVQTWQELTGRRDTARGEDIGHLDRGQEAIGRTGEYLGFGLVSLANSLDPDLIVIGGGMAALGESLLGPARRVLRQRALPGSAQCPLVAAQLGADASVIGAACLAMA